MDKFQEIIDSFINGQYKQGKAMIKKLNLEQRKEFYWYMKHEATVDGCIVEEITVIMITRNF